MTDDSLTGATGRVITPCGSVFATVNLDNGVPSRVWLDGLGKQGTCVRAWAEVTSRLLTIALQHGATIEELKDAMSGTLCHRAESPKGPDGPLHSCMDRAVEAIEMAIIATEPTRTCQLQEAAG